MKTLKMMTLGFLMTIACSGAFAFDLKGFAKNQIGIATGIGGSGAAGSSVAAAFIVSSKSINEAQTHLARAFELKEIAGKLELEAQALAGGSMSKKQIKKYTQLSKEADEAIREKFDSGAALTEEGKAHYRKAILPYSVGLASLYAAGSNAKDAGKSLDFASLYVIKELPGYTKRLSTTSKLMLTYAKSNQIEESDNAEEKLGDLEE